ncbi:hypothetical protein G9C85_00935 [Halorubellus sp. JP-L1]|uniref:DUF7547 family protein n=1 Tax=Halorubellus sp. JP-L1 TaxID=2715753 RepID=UPI00140B97C3|nr:hypothetical protein [Halorubellus sp. JP-L1]NHN40200.1 hypothetical protein [Halorubellus sp. JP-L1]
MTDRRDDDFADAAEDLTRALEDLRDELKREAPRGPMGIPRPPSPGEVLRFADEVAIPGTIAILEVNIKLLETVQRAIRLVGTGNRARERAGEARERASGSADRLADVSDRTLERLEGSLADLQTALESGSLPDDGAAGDLLDQARTLRDDVQGRLAEARERDHTLDDFEDRAARADDQRRADAASSTPVEDEDAVDDATGGRTDDAGGVQVDVDAELETLKDRYGKRDDGQQADGAAAGSDGDGADGDASDRSGNGDGSSGGNGDGASDDDRSGDGDDDPGRSSDGADA